MECSSVIADGLTNQEILRYGRQLILPEFGVKAQQLLKDQSALIVGCGGLGCPAAIYLSAAGIGTLGLLDHDVVEVSNLHRQILHKEAEKGNPKCHSARATCADVNSLPNYKIHHVAIDSSNAMDIISEYDVVLDCTDNVATRYLLNDACILNSKPLVSGAALKFEGQLTVYNYRGGPCYRCLYPTPPAPQNVTSCSEGGVMGVVPGIIGTMQAQEAIKVLSSMQGVLSGRLFLYDGLLFSTTVIKLRGRQPKCAACGDNPTITKLIDYKQFCGVGDADAKSVSSQTEWLRISGQKYKTDYLDRKVTHTLIDTRPAGETAICRLSNSTNIPLSQLVKLSADELIKLLNFTLLQSDTQRDSSAIVCICHHGNDSQIAAKHITNILGSSVKVIDVIGGLDAWAKNIDDTFPRY